MLHEDSPLVSAYGSQENAYAALQAATESAAKSQGLAGDFSTVVEIGGRNVTVRGTIISGAVKIGTAYIPKP